MPINPSDGALNDWADAMNRLDDLDALLTAITLDRNYEAARARAYEASLNEARRDIDASRSREAKLREAIGSLYIKHAECEDGWYSCPMSDHGCVNPDDAGCTCGAEAHNRRVDSALALLRSEPKLGGTV